jgi:hypothetical protein
MYRKWGSVCARNANLRKANQWFKSSPDALEAHPPSEPPRGAVRTKYRLSDDTVDEIFVPETNTVEDTPELIRLKHGLKGSLKVRASGGDVDPADSTADWLGKTGELWDIVEFIKNDDSPPEPAQTAPNPETVAGTDANMIPIPTPAQEEENNQEKDGEDKEEEEDTVETKNQEKRAKKSPS